MTDTITLETGEVLDLSAYPLPEGIVDETFNRELLARAMDVSTVTITKWIDAGMPVEQRGGNGQSYAFRLSHCYAWRMWRDDRDSADRRAKEGVAAQMAMHFLGAEEEDAPGRALSPKEVKEWSEAELIRNKAAEQRGELVRAAQVQEVLDQVLVSFRNAVMNMPDFLEQEFSLTPHQVAKAEAFCDGILSETRRQIGEAGFAPGDVVTMSGREAG